MLNSLLKRPIAVLSVATAVLLSGLWMASRLPLEWTPKIELPIIRITASWPGASPRSVERFIAAPIGRGVQTGQGTVAVESFSEEGRTTVTLEVDEEIDLGVYIAEINDRLSSLRTTLPDRVRPYLTKQVPEALREEQGFMTLQLVGPLNPESLRKFAEQEVAPRLQSIQGLAEVVVNGGADQELRITLDRDHMAALGIEPGGVRQRLYEVLSDDVYGRLRENGRATLLLHPAEDQIEPLRRLVVSDPGDNRVVRLENIAQVQMSSAPVYSISRVDGQPVVTLQLSRSSGSHMLATAEAVNDKLVELHDTLPEGVRLLVADDRTEAVRDQLDDLVWRGGLGLTLVLLVLLFMLKSVRITAVVVFSVMVSLSIAFLLLALFEMTLNLLTIAGLVLVFGLLVDNSVVVVEQIQLQTKRMASSKSIAPVDWGEISAHALQAVWLPLLGGTLSTMAVLIPLVYLSGELRTLFLPFGVLVSLTLGASLVIAALVIPVLMKIIPVRSEMHRLRAGWLRRYSRWPYRLTSRFPRFTLLVLILALGIPLWLIPAELEEPEEGWSRPVARLAGLYNETIGADGVQATRNVVEPWLGGVLRPFTRSVNFGQAWNFDRLPEVSVRLGFPTGNPIERADSLMQQFEQIALQSASVSRTITQISERRAFLRVQFHEAAFATSEPYILRETLIQRAVLMGGVSVSVFGLLPEGYSSGSGGVSSGLTVEAYGPNYEDLEQLAERFAGRLQQASRRVFEVNTNAGRYGYSEEREVLRIDWDADAQVRTGLAAQALSSHLTPVLNTRFPFYYADLEGETRVPVRMLVAGADALEIDELVEQTLSVRDSLTVKLAGSSDFSIEKTPAAIEREDQQYKRYIRVDFRGPHQMAREFLDNQLNAMPLPAGYKLEASSFSFFNEEVAASYFWVIMGTLLLVFLVTAAVFESWKLPWGVMLSVPMALIGVAAGFLWSGANFAEGAFIGSVLLIGIAVNDSILLVDRYRQLKIQRPSAKQSILIRLAVKDRLRPMWTTTLTSVVAMLPLLIFPDDGDFWMGLAVTVVFGLLSSTLLAPFATVALLSKNQPSSPTPNPEP